MSVFDDILAGKYDKNGFTIYRVFRNENKEIIQIVFIKDGVFIERTLEQTINGEL